MPPRIGIVGSGCAGLGAAWALKDVDCEIDLFELSPKLGGHTNTETFQHGDRYVDVDTGFIVMNSATYPNFIRFLDAVGVKTVPTIMSFGVSRDHGLFEWSGDAKGVFAQWRNFFRPRHWRMIFDIIRFNLFALDILDDPKYAEVTIGTYLGRNGYSRAFCDDYLIPMTAAVWSTSPDKASLEFPAQTLIRFMWNHHLLSTLTARPDWLTIPNGSQQYIDAILRELGTKIHIHKSAKVRGITRPRPEVDDNAVELHWEDSNYEDSDHSDYSEDTWYTDKYNHVILACHGDQILDILDTRGIPGLSKPSSALSHEEKEIFSAFKTTTNKCYLHSDTSLMPARRDTWSSWNYLINTVPHPNQPAGVSLTYNMNILQHIDVKTYGDVLVTMNPDRPPRSDLIQGEYYYDHPLYTVEAIRAQNRLEKIQGKRGVSYCGAWTKYGFHEDGFSSGLKTAMRLGAKLPFEFVDSTHSAGIKPTMSMVDLVARGLLICVFAAIRLVEIVLGLPGISWWVEFLSLAGEIALDWFEERGILR